MKRSIARCKATIRKQNDELERLGGVEERLREAEEQLSFSENETQARINAIMEGSKSSADELKRQITALKASNEKLRRQADRSVEATVKSTICEMQCTRACQGSSSGACLPEQKRTNPRSPMETVKAHARLKMWMPLQVSSACLEGHR